MASLRTLRKIVKQIAVRDAELFTRDFPGKVCRTEKSDWDAVAWVDEVPVLQREHGATDAQIDGLWPVYAAALTAETQRLAALANA